MVVNSEMRYENSKDIESHNLIHVDDIYEAVFNRQYQELFYNDWYNLSLALYELLYTHYNYYGYIRKSMLINDNGAHADLLLEIKCCSASRYPELKIVLPF